MRRRDLSMGRNVVVWVATAFPTLAAVAGYRYGREAIEAEHLPAGLLDRLGAVQSVAFGVEQLARALEATLLITGVAFVLYAAAALLVIGVDAVRGVKGRRRAAEGEQEPAPGAEVPEGHGAATAGPRKWAAAILLLCVVPVALLVTGGVFLGLFAAVVFVAPALGVLFASTRRELARLDSPRAWGWIFVYLVAAAAIGGFALSAAVQLRDPRLRADFATLKAEDGTCLARGPLLAVVDGRAYFVELAREDRKGRSRPNRYRDFGLSDERWLTARERKPSETAISCVDAPAAEPEKAAKPRPRSGGSAREGRKPQGG